MFNFKINLIQHKRIHNDKKPYNDCNDCKKSFNNEQDFNNHLITKHSNIDARPYKCEICPAAFKRSNNLKRHIQTHAEKPYVCEVCVTKLLLVLFLIISQLIMFIFTFM